MKILCLISILCLSLNMKSQSNYNSDFVFIDKQDSIEAFYISRDYVTNKEYLTYVFWNYFVYQDYPEVFIKTLPGFDDNYKQNLVQSSYPINVCFDTILKYTNKTVKNYFYNPFFIDYPVVGISYEQAIDYCNWLSDRYNEDLLIKNNYLNPNPNQKNEDCFNLESYYFKFYEGSIKNIIDENWFKNNFSPTFRLPSKNELDYATKSNLLNKTVFKKVDKKANFLEMWQKWYFNVNKNNLSIFMNAEDYVNKFNEYVIGSSQNISVYDLNTKFEVLTIDNFLDSKHQKIEDIYLAMGYSLINLSNTENIEKNNLGLIPFTIIGFNQDNSLKAISRKRLNEMPYMFTKDSLSVFRYAVSSRK